MAKFDGTVGYVERIEKRPGIWGETPTERIYSGDVVRNNIRWTSDSDLNDDLTINTMISIIADEYTINESSHIRYVKWNGAYWKVTNIDMTQRPRIILTMGGVYNGITIESSNAP